MNRLYLQLISAYTFLLITGCIYDPPAKGKEINVFNQSNHPIIAVWDINDETIRKYDTVRLNGKMHIQRMPGYVPEYGTYRDFIRSEVLDEASNANKQIKYFIIDDINSHLSAKEILDSGLYKYCIIHPDSILENRLNNLLYKNNTILLQHHHYTEVIND